MKRNLMLLLMALITAVMLCPMSIAMAAETIFTPTVDTWIRESAPTSSYDNDRLCVWMSPDSSGDNRHSILQFDVSGIGTLTSAHLDLYLTSYWRNATATGQIAELLTPAVPGGNVSWNDIYSGSYTGILMETFGTYVQAANTPTDQYYSSGTASVADLAAINAQKDASSVLTFLLKPVSTLVSSEAVTEGRHDWADCTLTDTTGAPATPTLFLNGQAAGIAASSDAWVRELDGVQYENDWISVWYDERDPASGERLGIVAFDLSNVVDPITSAEMALYSPPSSSSNEAFIQEAFLLELAAGVEFGDIDWATYNSVSVTEVALDTLGEYSLPGGDGNEPFTNAWAYSDGSAADVAKLEAIRQAGGSAVIAFRAVEQEVVNNVYESGQREWGDTGYDAARPEMWPHLVVSAVPEPSAILLILSALASLIIMRRK